MPFIDLNESQDRRLQMLLQTAQAIQQNKIAREESQAQTMLGYAKLGYRPIDKTKAMSPGGNLPSKMITGAYGQPYVPSPTMQSMVPQYVFDPNTGEYTQTGVAPKGSQIRSKAISPETYGERATVATRAKSEVELDYPTLDDKAKSAVSAYRYIAPRIERINSLIDSKVFGENALERFAKQITVDAKGELLIPPGHPLEELVGLYNDIKLTGFNIAGTAFTGTEKETAFALLDPRNKSDSRIKRDVNSFMDLFGTRVEAGVEGLRGAKKTAEEIKNKKQSSGEEYSLDVINKAAKAAGIKGKIISFKKVS